MTLVCDLRQVCVTCYTSVGVTCVTCGVCAGDMGTLGPDTKQALCRVLEEGACGGWESLARALGMGILSCAFRLSPSPATTLLDSYEVTIVYIM